METLPIHDVSLLCLSQKIIALYPRTNPSSYDKLMSIPNVRDDHLPSVSKSVYIRASDTSIGYVF